MAGRRPRLLGNDPAGRKPHDPFRTYMWCSPCARNHADNCSFLLGHKASNDYNERQNALRHRIRQLHPRLDARERALFGLVVLQLDVLDAQQDDTAHWTLEVLATLVAAFETAEAPASTEPP